MPRIIGHTPPWLSQPAPGARIFSDPEAQAPASPSKRQTSSRPNFESPASASSGKKLVAHRGSEVFTVVGNKIRWADLARVKDEWEDKVNRGQSSPDTRQERSYRTLKTPVFYEITSITVSPSGHFIAISTEHSVHVAILPDSARLQDGDQTEIKLKAYHVGPTTHVIPEAPLAAVLWHPLAMASSSSDCLATVTTDAALRLWEFDRANHWSFEQPALAIDLRKLADGTSSDQDFEPSGFGKNRGFSADVFDMEAAAACFGGSRAENEDPWASMTLWTCMANGDVYALCPLLPSKWIPSTTTIAALSTSTVAQMASIADDVDPDDRQATEQRLEWVRELDEETIQTGNTTSEPVRLRPSNPSIIPRLQGPFELPVDLEDDVEACDILVVPANLDEEGIFSGEDDYEVVGGSRSLPFAIVNIATTDNNVHALMELEGVIGQWLPKKGRATFSVPTWDSGEFVLLDTVSLSSSGESVKSQPTFTRDDSNRYQVFVTTTNSVLSLSFEGWAAKVGGEVTDEEEVDNGLQSRLVSACQGTICEVQTLISQDSGSLSTAMFLENSVVGTLLLTMSDSRALATQLDQTSFRTSKLLADESGFATSTYGHARTQSTFRASQSLMQVIATDSQTHLETPPTREPYASAQVFYDNPVAPVEHMRSRVPIQHRSALSQKPMLMSPVVLDIMTSAHRTFSGQTAQIERGVAELFRRCERLREELSDQVEQMVNLAAKLQQIKSGSEEYAISAKTDEFPDTTTHDTRIADRVANAQERQQNLYARYERVRRRAAQMRTGNQALSAAEITWIEGISDLSKRVGVDADAEEGDDKQVLGQRFDAIEQLSEELVAEAKRLKEATEKENHDAAGGTPGSRLGSKGSGGGGTSRYRRQRTDEIMEMVEREGMVIEAVRRRLADLGVEA